VTVTEAAPFHLIADSADGLPLDIRRTIAGDAWDRELADSCGVPTPAGTSGSAVSLGLPTLGVGSPAPRPAAESLTLHGGATTIPIYAVDDAER
jgi:tRNA-2-methylthio-N6-dimethylallyladenosine synthase